MIWYLVQGLRFGRRPPSFVLFFRSLCRVSRCGSPTPASSWTSSLFDDASAEFGADDLGRVLLADYLDVVERVDGIALIDLVVVFLVEDDALVVSIVVWSNVENRQLMTECLPLT